MIIYQLARALYLGGSLTLKAANAAPRPIPTAPLSITSVSLPSAGPHLVDVRGDWARGVLRDLRSGVHEYNVIDIST